MDAPSKPHGGNIRKNRVLHPCPECGKTFTKRSNMLIHARIHTGETPYVCKYAGCGRSYKWLSSINFHEGRCERKHMGLAVPAPRPPPPPAAAEAARVAAAAAAAAAAASHPELPARPIHHHPQGQPHPHYSPLPPPLPSYHSLQSYTQGRSPSPPPPPPPPPLRPPPSFSSHQHAMGGIIPPSTSVPGTHGAYGLAGGNSTSGLGSAIMQGGGVLGGGLTEVLPMSGGAGFCTGHKGKRFRGAGELWMNQGEAMMTMGGQAVATMTPGLTPLPGVALKAKKLKVAEGKTWCGRKRGGGGGRVRPLIPLKRGIKDDLPGSPESATSKELRDILAPYAPAMLLSGTENYAPIPADVDGGRQGPTAPSVVHAHQAPNALEGIGESFGLPDEDLFISNCSIGAVFEELAGTGNGYQINHLEQCSGDSAESISLF